MLVDSLQIRCRICQFGHMKWFGSS